jgi:transcriptional regulator with XRE-family HTH domain
MSQQLSKGAFGSLLRYWRQVRELSQEEVALEIDSSIKHLSFLENGKSLPSRDIVLRLVDYLRLSGRETNNLLAAAGHSSISIEKMSASEADFFRTSMVCTLRGLDPFPTAIINRTGDVQMVNRGWIEILGKRVPSLQQKSSFNLLDIYFSEDGLKPFIEDWEDTVCALLVALQQEVIMFEDRAAINTLQHVLADNSIPVDWRTRGANRMTLSGMYNRLCLPGEKPRTYLHVFNTVGSMRFEPDPALMIYSIFPRDEETTMAWHGRLQANIYQHPLLMY